ncbi:MAG TPA: Asp-tRNA(Asn)/Glu-tRNA(Gln) amidotransferase subunit GatB, partial [Candidatus Saccharimonadales bacterium]
EVINKYGSKISKKIANWLASDVQGYVADRIFTWDQVELDAKAMSELADMVETKVISSTSAKMVLKEMLLGRGNPQEIAKSMKLIQVSGTDDLMPIVKEVIANNPDAVTDLKSGQDKAIGYLVGQVMKLSQGKANPEVSKRLIKQELGL